MSKIIKYLGISLQGLKACTLKTITKCSKKLKNTQIVGNLLFAHGLKVLLLKAHATRKKISTYSVLFLSKFQQYFSQK